MTAVSMVVIAGILAVNDRDAEKALPSILLVFLLAGLMQISSGILGLRRYIRYIPYPAISGFMTAIGLINIVTQILPAVGYYPKEERYSVETFKPEAEELILENMLEEEAGEGILEQPRDLMERIDIIPDLIPEDHIFDDLPGCMVWIRANIPVSES